MHRLTERLSVILDFFRRNIDDERTTSSHRRASAILFCLLAVALAGCHGSPPNNERAPVVRIQFSPNAEPLSGGPLGQPKCEEALSGWFERVDSNHDGSIDRDEFLADAHAQFARMDLRHAGYVTSADLSEFRAPYEPPPTANGPSSDAEGSNRRRPPAADGPRQRGPSVDTRADPVMSADKTVSFKVTETEFIAQANDIFNGLDLNHDGRITRAAVIGSCNSNVTK